MQRVPLRLLDECTAERILETDLKAVGDDLRTSTLYVTPAGELLVMEERFIPRPLTFLQRNFGWPAPTLDPAGVQLFRVSLEEALLLAVEASTVSRRFAFMVREKLAAGSSLNGKGGGR